jgi:TatD DNase family protein
VGPSSASSEDFWLLRYRKNEPAHAAETARKVAELKGVTLKDLASITTASSLFGLTVS